MRITRRIVAGLAVLLVLVAVLAAAAALVSHEHHRGFFSPVWSQDGASVYFIERETKGVTWGLGWEHFTPPAYAHVTSDAIRLQRLDPADGSVQTLESWPDTPVSGRTIRACRGRIFETMSARIAVDDAGLDYRVRTDVTRVPRSDPYRLQGRWPAEQGAPAGCENVPAGPTPWAEDVLRDGIELITVPGREFFACAVLAVETSGDYRVLIANDKFVDLYPDGVPPSLVQERSRRAHIERTRELRRVRTELLEEHMQAGLSEGAARLRVSEDMVELGYYPKGPRLVAEIVDEPPEGLPVVEVSERELFVGLLGDIREAIASPGKEVRKSMGKYIVHRDYDTSRRLNEWLGAGNDEFLVRHQGVTYQVRLLH